VGRGNGVFQIKRFKCSVEELIVLPIKMHVLLLFSNSFISDEKNELLNDVEWGHKPRRVTRMAIGVKDRKTAIKGRDVTGDV
jgi:hypothetical protein